GPGSTTAKTTATLPADEALPHFACCNLSPLRALGLRHGWRRGLLVRGVVVPVLHLSRRTGRPFRRPRAGSGGDNAAFPEPAGRRRKSARASGRSHHGPDAHRPFDVRWLSGLLLRH